MNTGATPRPVQTPRLALRRPRASDAEAVFAYASDSEVTRYLSWRTHASMADTHEFLRVADKNWDDHHDFPYVIEHEGRVIGGTGLTPVGPGTLRTGYVLARAAWGKGLATEALQAVTQAAFEDPDVDRVEALVHPDNTQSIRVLEKCGFRSESLAPRCGVLPNLDCGTTAPDVHTYVRLRQS